MAEKTRRSRRGMWTIGQLDMEEKKKVVDMEREEEEEMEKDWKEG